MSADALHHPPLMPHLLVDGLNRYNDEPCLYLGDRVASYREVREATSRMVQALQSKGLKDGKVIAVLSANRPEVLSNIAAMHLPAAWVRRCTPWVHWTITPMCSRRPR